MNQGSRIRLVVFPLKIKWRLGGVMNNMKPNLLISLVLIVLIVVSRLLPHVWNVAPVAAVALLAGAVLPKKWVVAIPLLGMLLSDWVIGFYRWPVMLAVYLSFALIAIAGAALKKMKPVKLVVFSLASSTLFFLVTNFAVWAVGDWYPKTWAGLALCYTWAIPFFRNTILGDLIFTGVLFGAYSLVQYIVKNKIFGQATVRLKQFNN